MTEKESSMKRAVPLLFLLTALPAQAAPGIALRSQPDPDPQSRQFVVHLERPAPVALTCVQDGHPEERHRVVRSSSTDHTITVRGLLAGATYRCEAETIEPGKRASMRSPSVSFLTAPLPLDLTVPKITVASQDLPGTAYTLYNYGKLKGWWRLTSNYLVILDAQGKVRWYLAGPGAGDVDATYLGNDRISYGGYGDVDYAPTLVGLDKKVQFTATAEAATPTETASSFNHDAGISADGTSFFTFSYQKNDGIWTGFDLKQIDIATNRILWTWDSLVDGVGTGVLPSGSSEHTDPFHANAIDDHWEDGRLYLYVNMRNQYQMMKIDYETKEVVWKLGYGGDFTLLEADGTPAADSRWFSNEHDAKRVGDFFVVYDNGTDDQHWLGVTPQSRALRLELDEEAMTARIAFEWTEPGWVEPIWGGHDLLPNGNALVAIGHCRNCGAPAHNSALIELDPAGKTVWRADFQTEYDTLYRAQRIDGCAIFANQQYCPSK
jgi:hypothetical protein